MDKNFGWICPKCKKVISPYEVGCPYCNEKPQVVYRTKDENTILDKTDIYMREGYGLPPMDKI